MVCNRISNKLFAAKGEKQDMSTGENIKRIRKFRGMTQKELGIAIGIGEESASPRMAQYETDNRTPRKEMLHKMAVVLDVDPRNISIPTGYREEDMIYRLLVLEDYFPKMKLERNGMFVYESVPGTAVNHFAVDDSEVTFAVEGNQDAQITVQLEDDREYEVFIDGIAVGGMTTNVSGKLVLSVELNEGVRTEIRITGWRRSKDLPPF